MHIQQKSSMDSFLWLWLLLVTYQAVCVYGRQRHCPSALLHIVIHLVCKVFGFRVARMSQPKPSVCLSSDDRRLRVTFTQRELFPHFRGTEDTSSFVTCIFSMLSFCCKTQLIRTDYESVTSQIPSSREILTVALIHTRARGVMVPTSGCHYLIAYSVTIRRRLSWRLMLTPA